MRSSVRLSGNKALTVKQNYFSNIVAFVLIWPFFMKLCWGSHVRKELFGIKMGKFCQINAELWPLIYVYISFSLSILSINLPIFFKLCIGVHIRSGFWDQRW